MRAVAILLLALTSLASARIYDRCTLARELLYVHRIPRAQIADWICLVQAESGYNTRATNENPNKSLDYGLFQINDKFWCNTGSKSGDCNVPCSRLIDDYIWDDVACAKLIYSRHNFNAWKGWKDKCRGENLSSYVAGCRI